MDEYDKCLEELMIEPIDFMCARCGHEWEVFMKRTDPNNPPCPKCNRALTMRKKVQGFSMSAKPRDKTWG